MGAPIDAKKQETIDERQKPYWSGRDDTKGGNLEELVWAGEGMFPKTSPDPEVGCSPGPRGRPAVFSAHLRALPGSVLRECEREIEENQEKRARGNWGKVIQLNRTGLDCKIGPKSDEGDNTPHAVYETAVRARRGKRSGSEGPSDRGEDFGMFFGQL